MGTSNKKPASINTNSTATISLTPNGNKIYPFTRVSDEERNRLRVDVYEYLL
jgi:hypothetical protein